MVKRMRSSGCSGRPYSNKRAKVTSSVNEAKRAYRNSSVPAASRGYRPNAVERKVIDSGAITTAVSTTPVSTAVNLIAAGSDFNQRIGRKVCIKSLYIRGRIYTQRAKPYSSSGEASAQTGRLIILWDEQPNGTLIAAGDVLTSNDTIAHLNINSRDRFKVLHDKTYAVDALALNITTNTGASGRNIHYFKKYKKINMETIYNSVNNTIADVTSGALIVFWVGDTVAGVNDMEAVWNVRVRYSDQ